MRFRVMKRPKDERGADDRLTVRGVFWANWG